MAEAEALRAKLEREKQELRDFLEQGRHTLYMKFTKTVVFNYPIIRKNYLF